MTSGGVVPGGNPRSMVWHIAVTCVTAMERLTLGRKKILITAMPFSDCDSWCSMSLTVMVNPRSELLTMRIHHHGQRHRAPGVADRDGESALGVAHDAVGHLARRHTRVAPHHADHGNVDFGENVDRGAQNGDGRKNDDEQSHHHKRIRTAKR